MQSRGQFSDPLPSGHRRTRFRHRDARRPHQCRQRCTAGAGPSRRRARRLAEMRIPHCSEWLHWRCDLSLSAARERIRVAHALKILPAIASSFSSGEQSYSKVRALTRVARPDNEEALKAFALNTTAARVEERCRELRCTIALPAAHPLFFTGKQVVEFFNTEGTSRGGSDPGVANSEREDRYSWSDALRPFCPAVSIGSAACQFRELSLALMRANSVILQFLG